MSPRSDAPSGRAGSTCRAPARGRRPRAAGRRLRGTRATCGLRAHPRAAGAAGGAARPGSRAGSTARRRAGRAPAHALRARTHLGDDACLARVARVAANVLDQLQQPGHSCSTSTAPRIVPSRRTSRRSGAAVSDMLEGDSADPELRGRRWRRRRSSSHAHRRRPTTTGAAGDDEHDALSVRQLATPAGSDQRAERRAAREVGRDAGRLGQQLGIELDLVVGDSEDAPPVARAAPSARSPCDGSPTASERPPSRPGRARSRGRPRSCGDRVEPSAWPANIRGVGSRASPARVSSAKPCVSFANSVPLAAGETTASGSCQSSCSAISNEIVFAPSAAYG